MRFLEGSFRPQNILGEGTSRCQLLARSSPFHGQGYSFPHPLLYSVQSLLFLFHHKHSLLLEGCYLKKYITHSSFIACLLNISLCTTHITQNYTTVNAELEVVVAYFRILLLYVRRNSGNNKNPKTLHMGIQTYRHTRKPSTRDRPQIPGATYLSENY